MVLEAKPKHVKQKMSHFSPRLQEVELRYEISTKKRTMISQVRGCRSGEATIDGGN